MQPKKLWRAVALIILGTTAGLLALEFRQFEPDSATAGFREVNRKPLSEGVSKPAREASEPASSGHRESCKIETIQLRHIQAAAVVKTLIYFYNANPPETRLSIVVEAEPQHNMIVIRFPDGLDDGSICKTFRHLVDQLDVRPLKVAEQPSNRRIELFRLHNVIASDAAASLHAFLANANGILHPWRPTLQDAVIVADLFTNTLIISVPADNGDERIKEIAALVAEIDVVPLDAKDGEMAPIGGLMQIESVQAPVEATVAVFELKKADAIAVKCVLETMFLGTTTAAGDQAEGNAGATTPANIGSAVLSVVQTGQQVASRFALSIKIDDPSNSVIVTGSPKDLSLLRSVIEKLDNINVARRMTKIIQINNVKAAEVVSAVQTFVANAVAIQKANGEHPLHWDSTLGIILIAEPASNKLIINAWPEYMDEVLEMVVAFDVH